jgi:cell wall assembly regulator SMI1
VTRGVTSLADALRALAGRRLTDADGETHALELLPPASPEELRMLESRLPGPLPDEIRAALTVTTGLANGPLESFSLLDLEGFGLDEAFPYPYSIAHDGFGNYWILDVQPGVESWGPVWFACHDPAVVAFQAESIEAFLEQVVSLWHPGRESTVAEVRERAVHRLWRDDAHLQTPESAARGDAVLTAFAASLPPEARLADLRAARVGDGFAWGRFGPRTEIRRAGGERIWAVLPPQAKPGFLRRLFGASS